MRLLKHKLSFKEIKYLYTLQTIKRRKVNWIALILRRICLLKHVIEGKMKDRRHDKTSKKT
jgi:hypothetical protein